MTFEELDNKIDKLHYDWQKAICYQMMQKIRKDYKYKTSRKESNNDRKSKS